MSGEITHMSFKHEMQLIYGELKVEGQKRWTLKQKKKKSSELDGETNVKKKETFEKYEIL